MKKSSKNSEYYLKYNLVADPFPVDVEDKVLFLSSELSNRLEHIKDGIISSQNVILVCSAPGGGKTVLSKHLATLKKPDWTVCLVKGDESLKPESLAHQIIQQAFPDETGEATQSVNKLHKYLEHSFREKIIPVFIIDDAHKLSFETLQFILQLADLRYNESLFRFVLFANDVIHDKLAKPGLEELCTGVIDSVYIPSLSKEQANTYIEYRLSSYGEVNKYPFDDDSLNYIYKISGGLPRGINLLAKQIMQAPSKLARVLKTSALVAFILILITISFFSTYLFLAEEADVKQTQTATLALPPAQPLSEQIKEPLKVSKAPAKPVASAPAKASTRKVNESLSLKLSDMMFSLPSPALKTSAVSRNRAGAKKARVEKKKVAVTKPVQNKPVTTSKRTTASAGVFSDIHGANWLRRQPAKNYMLQLISASAEKTIVDVIARYPDLRDGLAGYTRYTKSGKPRYMLMYGPFSSRSAATSGIGKLPEELKSLKPWPRSFSGIVKDLDKY